MSRLPKDDVRNIQWLIAKLKAKASRSQHGYELERQIDSLELALDLLAVPEIFQEWVKRLPLRHQGVLTRGIRGPDGFAKEHPVKPIVRAFRACVMISARIGRALKLGEDHMPDSFMQMSLFGHEIVFDPMNGGVVPGALKFEKAAKDFFCTLDEHNVHFLTTLLYCASIVGAHHPHPLVRDRWWQFYLKGCKSLHMKPETRFGIHHRLRDGVRQEDSEE